MTQRENSDKRIHERRGIQLPCRIHRDSEQWYAYILDLSLQGAFVEVEADLTAGSSIEIVCFPGQEELRLPGIVRHSGWFLLGFRNASGVGVEFEQLSPECLQRLRDLLQQSDKPAGSKFSLEK